MAGIHIVLSDSHGVYVPQKFAEIVKAGMSWEGYDPDDVETKGEAPRIEDVLKPRQLILCQVTKNPIGVKGAEPGDLLVVDLLDIGAKDDSLWGFNGFFSKQNGGGFLTDHFPLAQKSIWDFKGMYTSSRHIPGVSFAGLIHPGLIGCLPDPKLLSAWNERGSLPIIDLPLSAWVISTVLHSPASIAATRDRYMSRASPWITLPKTT